MVVGGEVEALSQARVFLLVDLGVKCSSKFLLLVYDHDFKIANVAIMDQMKIQNAVNLEESGTMKISMKHSFPCTTRASACFVSSTIIATTASNSSGSEDSYACY